MIRFKMFVPSLVLALMVFSTVGTTKSEDTELHAKAVISGGENGITGTAFLTEENGKVFVSIHVQGDPAVLTPGRHGVHIHEAGKCDAPAFTTAGGHYDPGPFGNSNTVTNHPFHMGDLPNLEVDAAGEGALHAVTTRVTLSPSDISVFHTGGTAIIIHKLEDQHSCQPDPATGLCTGVSGGGRLACGVIVPVSKSE
jgi:Cu-Zn family superoxide dismutase